MIGRRALLGSAFVAAWPAVAHEIEGNRATLVLRDGRHLALTLQIDLVSALQRTLAPAQTAAQFAAMHAALPPAQLEPMLQQARRRIEGGTSLTDDAGHVLALTHWRWPSAAQTQALLQRATMRVLVGGAHDHDSMTELRAEALAPRGVAVVQLQLPEALQPALVVWSQPRQGWSRAGAPPLRADFR